MKYFNLFTCCQPVLGASRSIVCDLQRDIFVPIPNALYHLLKENEVIEIEKIVLDYGNEYKEIIVEYFDYLEANELGFYSDKIIENLIPINYDNYFEPKEITNAIIDIIDDNSYIASTVKQLSELNCEAVEIRIFKETNLETLDHLLKKFENSSIRSVELLVPYSKDFTINNLLKLRIENSRLRKIIIHSAKSEKFYDHFEFYIFITKEIINGKNCCGVVNPYYFISKTDFFIESKNYNSCLNKKISIDENGDIKNCPSMTTSFGNIKNTKLVEALNNIDFKKYWNINKDQIEICKDCEFRYICTDCRAYTENNDNQYSKPLKCGYNPYTNEWDEASTNPLRK